MHTNQTVHDQASHRPRILIAAHPGRMRESLRLLIETLSEIEVIGCADDSSSALRMVSALGPALVLLDTNLPGEETATILHRIRGSSSPSRCLVLVDTQRQQQEAMAAGADVALIKGCATTKLFEVVQTLAVGRGIQEKSLKKTVGR